jgi:hypothetical protein
VRILLTGLLAAGLAGLIVVPSPASFLVAVVFALPAFLLGSAKLAIDLIELVRADLIADGALLVALGTLFVSFSMGNSVVLGALLLAALATQVVRLASTRRERPRAA